MHSNARAHYQFKLKRRALLQWLARQNVSQNEFARLCGISSGFMSQLLSGSRLPGPRTRRKILAAFPAADFDQLFEAIDDGH